MARYLQTAKEVQNQINDVMDMLAGTNITQDQWWYVARKLGHIVNLTVRCAPRGVQHTVRRNIVETAVGKYLRVTMREEVDERTGKSFHAIALQEKRDDTQ